jgi:hypothetical protein
MSSVDGETIHPRAGASAASSSSLTAGEPSSPTARPHNQPEVFGMYVLNKIGQPPEFHLKRRRIIIRSDGILVVAEGVRDIVKRAIPLSKIQGMFLRKDGLRLAFRVRGEHDLALATLTSDSEATQLLTSALNHALRANRFQFQARYKNADFFDFSNPNKSKLRLIKDEMTYPSMDEKVKVRAALRKLATYPNPPYALASWDSTTVPLRRPAPLNEAPATLRPVLEELHVVMHGLVEATRRVIADPAAPVAEPEPFADTETKAPVRLDEPEQRYMVISPTHVSLFDPNDASRKHQISIFEVASIELHHAVAIMALRLTNNHVLEINLVEHAIGTTYTTTNLSTVASCLAAVVERYGYRLEIADAKLKSDKPPATSPAAATAKAPAADGAGTCKDVEPVPTSPKKSVQFAAAVAAPADAASTLRGAAGTADNSQTASPSSPQLEMSHSSALAAPGLDDNSLKKLVKDYKAPLGEVCRRFMSPMTLLVRRCSRLTSRMTWEPRVLVITHVGVLLCSDDGAVRRTIDFEEIQTIVVTKHWKANAISLLIPASFDAVLKAHEDTPPSLTMSDIAAVISTKAPQAKVVQQDATKDKQTLKPIVGKGRNLRKPDDFETPGARLERMKSSSPQQSASPNRGSFFKAPANEPAAANDSTPRALQPEFSNVQTVQSMTIESNSAQATPGGVTPRSINSPTILAQNPSLVQSEYDAGSFATYVRTQGSGEVDADNNSEPATAAAQETSSVDASGAPTEQRGISQAEALQETVPEPAALHKTSSPQTRSPRTRSPDATSVLRHEPHADGGKPDEARVVTPRNDHTTGAAAPTVTTTTTSKAPASSRSPSRGATPATPVVPALFRAEDTVDSICTPPVRSRPVSPPHAAPPQQQHQHQHQQSPTAVGQNERVNKPAISHQNGAADTTTAARPRSESSAEASVVTARDLKADPGRVVEIPGGMESSASASNTGVPAVGTEPYSVPTWADAIPGTDTHQPANATAAATPEAASQTRRADHSHADGASPSPTRKPSAADEEAASPAATRPLVPQLSLGQLQHHRGPSGAAAVSSGAVGTSPSRGRDTLRVVDWPTPRGNSGARGVSPRIATTTAAGAAHSNGSLASPHAPSPLGRGGSVRLVDSDLEALAVVNASRRAGLIDDPAAVTTPRPDGREWLSFRVKLGDDFISFYADDAFFEVLQRFRREHRRAYEADGPCAHETVFVVCAEGPAIFTFTVSFLLYALEQPDTQLRHGSVLLREPAESSSGMVEWIEVPTATFCRLAREGMRPHEMALACVRELASRTTESPTNGDQAGASPHRLGSNAIEIFKSRNDQEALVRAA